MEFEVNNVLSGNVLNASLDSLRRSISNYYNIDEHDFAEQLYPIAFNDTEQGEVKKVTENIINEVRSEDNSAFFNIEALLQEYSLSDEDGVTLMCLAEALLRIPDSATRDALIKDKLSDKEWSRHLNKNNSLFVNASTWGLMIAGNLVDIGKNPVKGIFKRSTVPVIRAAVDRAMRIMGQHFVLGRTIKEAMKNARPYIQKGYDYSYDMLGESAITQYEADRYFKSYSSAIEKISENSKGASNRPSLSIKLSALHPRFEETHRDRVLVELGKTVESLINLGLKHGVGITIDAEEADRLELTMDLFKSIYEKPLVRGWGKFGLVVQAYSKRALPVLSWLTKLAQTHGDEIPVRLVKGAYWDTEIKHSQELGLDGYPVFTHKEYTDTAYLACARFLLSDNTKGCIYPQFASHNAHTVSSIKVMAPEGREFEFQRLHGMGDELYDSVLSSNKNINVRIYAPVGSHEDLLPYLVRRLLENGANSSFVHQLSDESISIDSLVEPPLKISDIQVFRDEKSISLPIEIFEDRENSTGVNLASIQTREKFMSSVESFNDTYWTATSIVDGESIKSGNASVVKSPFDHSLSVGELYNADTELAEKALTLASNAANDWRKTPIEDRADIFDKLGDLFEENRPELIALCQREAGKTMQDSIDEIREAVDFCRYYAQEARTKLGATITLPGPTGESNELTMEGRGVFVCISPWNFPLAIFIGQLAAAIVAGNTVIAKPAENTSLIAHRAVQMLFEAGLPSNVLQLLIGSGSKLGAVLNSDERVSGVVFTGSNMTARRINQTLAAREPEAGIAILIAETGGLNAMIVDSTALPEQVATDVTKSAFSSAGQRCSALRVLYVQDDIADRVIELVKGSMDELGLGNPQQLSTDVGPVIDSKSQNNLLSYIEATKATAKSFYQVSLPDESTKAGTFVPPTMLEIDSISSLKEEQFGPILHIVRFKGNEIDQVVNDINATKYGLTLGIHTRNMGTYEKIAKEAKVGNIYINRNQIGAVVGVNPFGGCGLSGTGPKAGGPHYLLRFVTEKTITNNTSAIGGNIDLLNKA